MKIIVNQTKEGQKEKENKGKSKENRSKKGDSSNMSKDFNLTEDQIAKMEEINKKYSTKSATTEEDRKKLKENKEAEIENILTQEQKDKMKEKEGDRNKQKGSANKKSSK